ncbi:hypothetical protein DL98DRAFT_592095 [Cadophora sp. DSE1049]|nr:hypothetical protein DL98DRAFT_592095 [Cadophora sp. DSE1049]
MLEVFWSHLSNLFLYPFQLLEEWLAYYHRQRSLTLPPACYEYIEAIELQYGWHGWKWIFMGLSMFVGLLILMIVAFMKVYLEIVTTWFKDFEKLLSQMTRNERHYALQHWRRIARAMLDGDEDAKEMLRRFNERELEEICDGMSRLDSERDLSPGGTEDIRCTKEEIV